jgi:hypothetical protein
MGFWSRLFTVGRVKQAPKGHTGALAPASVLRSHLGIRRLGLEDAVVTMSGGELRAVFEVDGFPLHAAGSEDARRFLGAFAAAINALPTEAAFLTRARPGGLGEATAAVEAQSRALAKTEPGPARIAADQGAHYRRLEAEGRARRTDNYLAVRGTDVEALVDVARKATGHFVAAGLRVVPLRGERMVSAVAESWRPGFVEMGGPWKPYGPHLVFRKIGHRAILEDRRPKVRVQAVTNGKALPR